MTDLPDHGAAHHPDRIADFRAARDLLLELRDDLPAARDGLRWPRPAASTTPATWRAGTSAAAILGHAREHLAPYERIRRI